MASIRNLLSEYSQTLSVEYPLDDHIPNAVKWSGSGKRMAKAKQQALRRRRQNKAALQGVFNVESLV
jgi:hypothetical protein